MHRMERNRYLLSAKQALLFFLGAKCTGWLDIRGVKTNHQSLHCIPFMYDRAVDPSLHGISWFCVGCCLHLQIVPRNVSVFSSLCIPAPICYLLVYNKPLQNLMAGWRNDSLFQFTLPISLPSIQERQESALLVEMAFPYYIPWQKNIPQHVIKFYLISELTTGMEHLFCVTSNLLNLACLFFLPPLRQPASCRSNQTVPYLRCPLSASYPLWDFYVDALV